MGALEILRQILLLTVASEQHCVFRKDWSSIPPCYALHWKGFLRIQISRYVSSHINPQIVRTSPSSALVSRVLERQKTQRRWAFQIIIMMKWSWPWQLNEHVNKCSGYPIPCLCGCVQAQGFFTRAHLGKSPKLKGGSSKATPLVFPNDFNSNNCPSSHEGGYPAP